MSFLKRYPALVAAGVSALGAVLGVFIKNPDLVAALLAVAGTFVGLHAVVTPVATAATQTVQAATTAATQVVQSLDQSVVGTVGELTAPAAAIVQSTVKDVVGALGIKVDVPGTVPV